MSKTTGKPDPFDAVKRKEYESGRAAAERMGKKAAPGLKGLIGLAAMGNQLDFFRDLEEVERMWAESPPTPSLDDSDTLAKLLDGAKTVTMLADNAGEAPFDLPLLRELEKRGLKTVYAVKGAPSQNDLTREDAERFGIEVPRLADTGTDWVGSDLAYTSEAFRDALKSADVIVAKGMANLETLSEYPEELAGKKVFFILMVKCPPVAEFLGLPLDRPAIIDAARIFGCK